MTSVSKPAWLLASALAVAFAALLWPQAADAQQLRDRCIGAPRALTVNPSGGSATFSAFEPLENCVTQTGATTFDVRKTCTFHCQHRHTWVPTGNPEDAIVRLAASPTPTRWSGNCTPPLDVRPDRTWQEQRSDCMVKVSAPTNVTAFFDPVADTTAPSPPVPGTPSPAQLAATIRWSGASDANLAGFDIFREDRPGAPIGRVGAGVTSFRATSLLCEADYSFRIEAFDTAGNFASSAVVSVRTKQCGPTKPPNTEIHVGPKKRTKSRAAFFHFGYRGSIKATKYQCKIDRKRWKRCSGFRGVRYRKLKPGLHTFRVRAGNQAGWDRTPAKFRWRVRR